MRLSFEWMNGQVVAVHHADPRVMISSCWIRQARRGDWGPGVTLVDDVLTINAVDRRVVYRIGVLHLVEDCYEAQWPD